jgi:integrase
MHNREYYLILKKHLYKRTIKNESGKSTKVWYYWYYDPVTHKQVRKSCGTGKIPVLTKREAEEIMAKMDEQERNYEAIKAQAQTMYTPGSIYLKFKKEIGEEISDNSLDEIHRYLNNQIIPWYGTLKLEELDPVQIQNDLLAQERSNSWRNRIICILDSIFQEAVRNKMLNYKPAISRFRSSVQRKKDIISSEEINTLFPEDFRSLSRIWDKDGKETDTGFMFGTFYALMVSTGLRLGEARAINPIQLIVAQDKQILPLVQPDGSENPYITDTAVFGLFIDRMFNVKETLVMHLKRGNAENPRYRVSLLPTRTIRYIRHWIMIRPRLVPELLFTFKGRKINPVMAEKRLHPGFSNTGIPIEHRVITPHSLRFTYNTRMRRLIPGEPLRLMIGHTTEGMTDYYTRLEIEEDFLSLESHIDNINHFWEEKLVRKR